MNEYRDILIKEWKRLWKQFEGTGYKKTNITKRTSNEDIEWFIYTMEELIESGKINKKGKTLYAYGLGEKAISYWKIDVNKRTITEIVDFNTEKAIEDINKKATESFISNPFSGASAYTPLDIRCYMHLRGL